MKKTQLSISIKGARESAREFSEAWRRAEQGKPAEQPIERLYFEDLATMLKVLTPRRLEMIKVLHEIGPVSVRALAGTIKRDYKNVHHDLSGFGSASVLSHGRPMADWRLPGKRSSPRYRWRRSTFPQRRGASATRRCPGNLALPPFAFDCCSLRLR